MPTEAATGTVRRPRAARAVVAVNALCLRPHGSGVQTYAAGLLGALPAVVDAEVVVTVAADAAHLLPPGVRSVVRPPARGWRRYAADARRPPPADVVHGLDVHLPARPGAPCVATVHDLSVWDRPEAVPAARRLGERAALAHALRRADALVAVSAFTAERIRARCGREATVVPLAPSPAMAPPSAAARDRVRAAYGLPERFVLFVGTVEPRKDLAGLGAACRAAGLPLVVAGARRGAPLPAGSRWLGYVPGDDLPALYGAATVVGYPSHYEGFGLPPLEAMACGAAVAGWRIPPLVEVLGDAAVLVRPGDTEALAAGLAAVAADEARRDELRRAGLVRAARYSWSATAEATAAVYRRLGVAA